MKKKVNLFIALLFAMTFMLGGVCYASETERAEGSPAAEENENIARSINTQQKTVNQDVTISGISGVIFHILIIYSWDEGYTSWFDSIILVDYTVKSEALGFRVNSFSSSADGNSSYATVTIEYDYNDGNTVGTATGYYHVDEYGEITFW